MSIQTQAELVVCSKQHGVNYSSIGYDRRPLTPAYRECNIVAQSTWASWGSFEAHTCTNNFGQPSSIFFLSFKHLIEWLKTRRILWKGSKEKKHIEQRIRTSILMDVSGTLVSVWTFIRWGNGRMLYEKSDPLALLARCNRCKSPTESRIKIFLGESAWIDNAFNGIIFADLWSSIPLPFSATKYSPPSLESCLNFTDLALTAIKNTRSEAYANNLTTTMFWHERDPEIIAIIII